MGGLQGKSKKSRPSHDELRFIHFHRPATCEKRCESDLCDGYNIVCSFRRRSGADITYAYDTTGYDGDLRRPRDHRVRRQHPQELNPVRVTGGGGASPSSPVAVLVAQAAAGEGYEDVLQ